MTLLRSLPRYIVNNRLTSSPPRRWAWSGSAKDSHTTNSTDTLDIQSDASKAGQDERARSSSSSSTGEKGGSSQATTQQDHRHGNVRAKEDHPEAPSPVIGMNDERGRKGH